MHFNGLKEVPAPSDCGNSHHLSEDHVAGNGSQINNFVKSWLREAGYFVHMGYLSTGHYFSGTPPEYVIPKGENSWREGNKGLYVAIHGINGNPKIWSTQLALLKEQHPDDEIKLPYVPRKGNCSLKEAADPIETMIRDYANRHPTRPVCLMGVSNGARIALELEVRLRDLKTPILVSSVAGAFLGTRRIDQVNRFGAANWIYDQSFVEDMRYQGDSSLNLLNRVRANLPEGVVRAYHFYASTDDYAIKPYTASLPFLKDKEVKYFVTSGENHDSIVSSVAAAQTELCIDWMNKHALEK